MLPGKIDAFLGFPREPQELRVRKIGHALVNTALDRPWSQYFCCLLAGNREFVRKNPVASKRVLRAILKTTDLCASGPASAARQLVDRGFAQRYDYALETLNDNPYDKWREYNPEDTLRFYALRMREAGFIKSSPQREPPYPPAKVDRDQSIAERILARAHCLLCDTETGIGPRPSTTALV